MGAHFLHQADEDDFLKLSKHEGKLTENVGNALGVQESKRARGTRHPTQHLLPGKATPHPSTWKKMPVKDRIDEVSKGVRSPL